MTLEQHLVLTRLVTPALFGVVGGMFLAKGLASIGDEATSAPFTARQKWCIVLGVLFAGAGLIASEFWSRGILFQPSQWNDWSARYQWQWLVWILPAGFLLLGFTKIGIGSNHSQSFAMWPLLFLLAIATLYVALAELETWGDRWQLVMHLILLGLVACVVNISSLQNLVSTGGSRWTPLVLLGQLGCCAAVALQSYASLGEWILACAGITLGVALISAGTSKTGIQFGEWPFSVLIYPLAISAVVSFLLTPFFQSKPMLPPWLFGTVLFLPAIVWFFDFVYGRYGRAWWRILLAAIVCILVLVAILLITKPFESEW